MGFLGMNKSSASPRPSNGNQTSWSFSFARYATIVLAFLMGMAVLQTLNFFQQSNNERYQSPMYQVQTTALRNPSDQGKCRFYMADSAVAPNSGLGMFAGVGLLEGEPVGFPDICIYIADGPREYTHIDTHTWGWSTFFGQFEGTTSRAACEGFATTFNTMPETHVNTKLVGPVQATTAGLKRQYSPGAGSITHYFGVHAETTDVVPAGGELTTWYGDVGFFDDETPKTMIRPQRSVQELQENGWCIDYIEIRNSAIKDAGRGAFVKQRLPKGTVVVPMPMQVFNDRKHFQHVHPEQLYINYCFQPANSRMILYGYGPGGNLINHSKKPNVKLQWSKNPSHKAELLSMNYETFWENAKPGQLILEVVALRDLQAGEELLLDYGREFDRAWRKHVRQWKPPKDALAYVYPEDLDETDVIRTVEEQKSDPYPANLMTMCFTPDPVRADGNHIEWWPGDWAWSETMFYCHILDRSRGDNGDFEYTVALIFYNPTPNRPLGERDFKFDPNVPYKDRNVDTKVPRRAIRWVEKPYIDDEHLENAFRHPIELPSELVPQAWITEK